MMKTEPGLSTTAQLKVVRELVIELAVAIVIDDEERLTEALNGLGSMLHITEREAEAALRLMARGGN